MKNRIALLLLPFGVFAYGGFLLATRIVSVVIEAQLLPLWDQAAHAMEGWDAYYHLKNLDIFMFVWKLWSRGLWPFVNNLWLTVFYFILGPSFKSALLSNVAAYVVTGVLSAYLLTIMKKSISVLSISAIVFLLLASPMYGAYATLSMLEIFGTLVQITVFISYVRLHEQRSHRSAVLFAVSLSLLFFTKFNYFFMVFVPMLLHEYISATKEWSLRGHGRNLAKTLRLVLSSAMGKMVLVYGIGMVVLYKTGGFEFNAFDQKISVRDAGASAYVVLYALLWNAWRFFRGNRQQLARAVNSDFRLRPLLRYFVLPVLVWFSIPYPNHINEFLNFMVNRTTENLNFFTGIPFYLAVVKDEYFPARMVFLVGIIVYGRSLFLQGRRSSMERWLILTSIVQIAMVVFHHQKEPRFIFLALMPVWLVISLELHYLVNGIPASKYVALVLSAALLCFGVSSFKANIDNGKIMSIVKGAYADIPALRSSMSWIKGYVKSEDSLAILGRSNTLSPALFRWNLGPPAGYAHFIGAVSRTRYGALENCSYVLLIEPTSEKADPEIIQEYENHRKQIHALLNRNRIAHFDDFELAAMSLVFRSYQCLKP